MKPGDSLPLILIVDDLFGRTHLDRRNEERANLCGQFLIEDVTGDEVGKGTPQKIKHPLAQAIFYRGQTPTCSTVSDIVENDLEGTMHLIREGWTGSGKRRWTMILLDLCFYTGKVTQESNRKTRGMPEGRLGDDDSHHYFGLRLLDTIHHEFPELPVVLLSSKPRSEVSLEFSRKNAMAFLEREESGSLERLREYLWRHGLIPDADGQIAGHSMALLFALRSARRAATDRRNILIRGERGSGKELFARYINRHSQNQGSFVTVNSSILTPELFASELFGIEAGTATQVRGRDGLIKMADSGDLFLDEIKDMVPQVQAGILRVIEQREIMPVGARKSEPVDVRFLSATNIDIEALAASGNFRFDLLDRLREGRTIYLPPLRERKEDISLLVEKFVRQAEASNSSALRRHIDEEALEKLYAYDWPGNIRELRNTIFNAVNDHPDVEHLTAVHIQIASPIRRAAQFSIPVETNYPVRKDTQYNKAGIDELLNALSTFDFESVKRSQLAGKLPVLQATCSQFLARYLKTILVATSKYTPDDPNGEIHIHPAMKMATGNTKLTASKAADLIKRVLSLHQEIFKALLEDPVLQKAYETAVRLRPRQGKSRKEL